MTKNKTPYLTTWKQVLLTVFTLGFWSYAWRSRMVAFTNQLCEEKKDAETQSILTILLPPFLIPWVIKLTKALNGEKTEDIKAHAGYRGVSKPLFIILQVVAALFAVARDIMLITVIVMMVVNKDASQWPYLIVYLVCRFMESNLISLPILIIAQSKINRIAELKEIEQKVPYSSSAVQSPYMSKGAFIALSILTFGIWTAISWVGKTTGFLNRVNQEKRHKLDETLLCILVPGYYFYWAKMSAQLVDKFSHEMQNENKIEGAVKVLSIVGYALIVIPPVISTLIVGTVINTIIQGALNTDVYMRRVDSEGILEIRNLRKCFPIGKTLFGTVTRELNAVKNASFVLKQGETLGIVGESGCGKTTMGRTILKLYPSEEGQIIFNGYDITYCPKSQTRKMRKDMQIIFQDPYSSLPPRSTVGGILTEPVTVHKIVPKKQRKRYVLDLMDKCGLRDYYYERYPHEFSGGQRQRICIARALSVNPKLVICDEPVSALDVSIQAQIINLLKDLQKNMGLTYLFISHDLSVVKYISDKIGVMYLGTMMEFGKKEDIFNNPLHPYTKALFSAIPNPNPDVKMNRIVLKGDIPSPANPPKGCSFHTRCPYAMDICKEIPPEYTEHEEGHFAACHLINMKGNPNNEVAKSVSTEKEG